MINNFIDFFEALMSDEAYEELERNIQANNELLRQEVEARKNADLHKYSG